MTGASDTQPAAPFDREAVREEIEREMMGRGVVSRWSKARSIAAKVLPILDRLLAESDEQVRKAEARAKEAGTALLNLTCSGSEFFKRDGENFYVDVPACEAYIREARKRQFRRTAEAIKAQQAARASLATVQADNARLREDETNFGHSAIVEVLQEHIVHLKADNAQKDAALRPFADEATRVESMFSRPVLDGVYVEVRLGACRAARKALSTADAKGGEPQDERDLFERLHLESMTREWFAGFAGAAGMTLTLDGYLRVLRKRLNGDLQPTNPRPVVPEELDQAVAEIDRLEADRNTLQNSYGNSSFEDGLITRSIARIDARLTDLRTLIGGDNGQR